MELVIEIALGIAFGSLIKFFAESAYLQYSRRKNDRDNLANLNRFQRMMGKEEFRTLDEYNDQWMLDAAEAAKAEEAALANAKRSRKK